MSNTTIFSTSTLSSSSESMPPLYIYDNQSFPISPTTARIPNELFEGYSDELLNFASWACIVFIIVGVPGNLLTIIALLRGRQTRNSTAYFIMNLSLSDLLFGCFNLPLAASTFQKRSWTYSDLLCRLFPMLRYGLLAVSLFTVSLITINRYIIIAHPRLYPRIYQRRYLILMVAGTWIISFSFMIPPWRGIWGRFGLDVSIGSCSILHDKNDRSPKEFLFVAAFMLPCLCIVCCYARIFYLVRKAAIRTREFSPTPKGVSNNNSNNEQENKPQQQQQAALNNRKTSAEGPTSAIMGNHNPVQVAPQDLTPQPFGVTDEDIEFIDESDSSDCMPVSYSIGRRAEAKKSLGKPPIFPPSKKPEPDVKDISRVKAQSKPTTPSSPTKASITTSFTRFTPRKNHNFSIGGNTSNASAIYPGKMSQKDRRLLKMILVIFISFVICYLPITVTKIWKSTTNVHVVNIMGYLLIYLTTCINPIIYVLMSSEYRQAYLNLLRCQTTDQKYKDGANLRKPKT